MFLFNMNSIVITAFKILKYLVNVIIKNTAHPRKKT